MSDEENPVQSEYSLHDMDGELRSGVKDGISSSRTRTEDNNDEAISTNRHTNGPIIRGKY